MTWSALTPDRGRRLDEMTPRSAGHIVGSSREGRMLHTREFVAPNPGPAPVGAVTPPQVYAFHECRTPAPKGNGAVNDTHLRRRDRRPNKSIIQCRTRQRRGKAASMSGTVPTRTWCRPGPASSMFGNRTFRRGCRRDAARGPSSSAGPLRAGRTAAALDSAAQVRKLPHASGWGAGVVRPPTGRR